jgi:capsular exopolysaccharide synthesis family protein
VASDRFSPRPDVARDDPIDIGRYRATLRRSLPLIAAIVIVLTGGVVAFSLLTAKTYSAEAQIIVDPNSTGLGTTDATTVQRELATLQTLVGTPSVLNPVASQLHVPLGTLESNVTATADQNANLISIVANASTGKAAADQANAVTKSFIARQTAIESDQLRRGQASLTQQIAQLRAQPAGQDVQGQIQALESRAAELRVAQASAGTDLQIARSAEVPGAPTSPRPLRNGVLALFVSLFLGVLAALAREQLRPRVGDHRELGQLLGLPVLTAMPDTEGRSGLRRSTMNAGIEREAYQTLSASLRLALPPDREHVLLLTSALHAEGKTTVAARLARLLAQAGHQTLVISGDMRWPRLDAIFGVEGRRGLSDLLADAQQGQVSTDRVREAIISGGAREGRANAQPDVLPSGTVAGDAATALLAAETLAPLFDAITDFGYTYVIVDAPPALGVGDTQVFASYCDELLVVSRLDRLTLPTVVDLREMLERLSLHALGLVVIGARAEASRYYTGLRDTPAGEPLSIVPR